MKKACQDRKYRDRDEERRAPHRDEWAPENCRRCGAKLIPRKKLRNDSPVGRWCKKTACQADREQAEREHGVAMAQQRLEVLTSDGDFWRAVFERSLVGNFEDCSECSGKGLEGWIHPNHHNPREACNHLGARPIARATAIVISPPFAEMVESS